MSLTALSRKRQLELGLHPLDETEGYLDSGKWGYFTVLERRKGADRITDQASYQLRDLPKVLDLVKYTEDRDTWITQAVFSASNRRKVSLAHVATCFVDIDYYHIPKLSGLGAMEVCKLLENHCLTTGIPAPSLIVDSGNGIQAKWFHEALPRKALPRWDAVQKHLCNAFSHLGGDHHARDASRVLRVVTTFNQKTGRMVDIAYSNRGADGQPRRYKFDDLAEAVLPVSREQAQRKQRKAGKPAKATSINGKHSKTLNSLNWHRLEDLRLISQLRGGDVGDGLREPLAFYACNFYCLRYYKELAARYLQPLGEYQELSALCREIAPDWTIHKIRDKTSNLYPLMKRHAAGEKVIYQGKEYPPLYTPESQTLIDLLQITPEEERQLSTIISDSERRRRKAERNRKRDRGHQQSREQYEAASREKREQAKALKIQGLSQRQIAEKMGENRRTIRKYLDSL